MDNTEVKQIIDKLYGLSEEDMKEMFGTSSTEVILNSHCLSTIKCEFDKREEPKYGDVYVNNEFGEKCIFLAFERDNVWYLSERHIVPQKNDLELFKKWYKKTNKNVADKIRGCFE